LWTAHSQCLRSLTDTAKSLLERGKLHTFGPGFKKTGISLTWIGDKAAEHKSYHSHSRLEFPQALVRIRWLPDASYSLSFWLVSQENCSLSQFCLKVDCAWTLTLILLSTGLNREDKSIPNWLIALFCGSKHGLKTWLQLSMAQNFSWKEHLSWKLHFGAFSVYDTSHLPRTRGFRIPQLWVTIKAKLGNVHWPNNLRSAPCESHYLLFESRRRRAQGIRRSLRRRTSSTMTAQHQPRLLGI